MLLFRLSVFIIPLLFFLIAPTLSKKFKPPKKGEIFKPKTIIAYNEFLKNHTYSLVLFTIPKCSLSKYAKKSIKTVSRNLKNKANVDFFENLGIAIVNLKKINSLQENLNISSTPLIMIFRETFPFKRFIGAYEKTDFLQWFLQEITRDIPKISNFDEFRKNNEKSVSVLVDREDLRKHSILQVLLKMKENFNDLQYGYHFIIKKGFLEESQCFEAEIYFKNRENEEKIKFSDEIWEKFEFLKEKIEEFFFLNEKYNFFDENKIRRVLAKKIGVFMFWSFFEDKKPSEKIEKILKFSEFHQKEFRVFFARIEFQDVNIRKWLRFLGFDLEKTEKIDEKIIYLKQDHIDDNIEKYILDDKITVNLESLEEFHKGIYTGKTKPYLRNLDVKSPEITENLIRMNAFSYKKYITENKDSSKKDKDIFIAFCPESDQRCGKFLGFFEDFAAGLYHITDLLFGIFDPEKNDFLGKEIRVFPTLRLFPAGNRNKFEEFRGEELNQENLDIFLKGHLTVLDTTKIRRVKEDEE